MFNSMLPPELQEALERELEPGEHIDWCGQPRGGLYIGDSTGAVLFGIPWTAFAIFWMGMAYWMTQQGPQPQPEPWFLKLFPLWGILFILIGLGLLSSPSWVARKLRQTEYSITDRRAILMEGGRSRTVRSFPPAMLTELFRRERKDGSGDIVLKQRGHRDSDGDLRTTEIAFLRIPDVHDVERRLRSLAATAAVTDPTGQDE